MYAHILFLNFCLDYNLQMSSLYLRALTSITWAKFEFTKIMS